MLYVPFLTDLDSRAAVKGSRDPLGMQPVWTRFGRRVVGNLTTVSNSVRDFTTLLLGYFFTEQVVDDTGPGTDLECFLKWEQLAAYARAQVNQDFKFRGTERVRKNLAEGGRVTVSADRAHQILGNQKIYGLWGLYTVPARASGLVDGDPPRLPPLVRDTVEKLYLPLLAPGAGRDARRIREVLRERSARLDLAGKDQGLIQAVARALQPTLQVPERDFFRTHLLFGGPQDETAGRQQRLAELLTETLDQMDFTWSPAVVARLAQTARARGPDWQTLADDLERIRVCETVLAPVAALFSFLQGLDGQSVSAVTQQLRDAWGETLPSVRAAEFAELRTELAAGDAALGDRWVAIARALATGDYPALLELLLEQNRWVMAERGSGAPWIEQQHGKLRVRFRDEQGALPARAELPALWKYSYFIDSLRGVAGTLRED